MTTRRIRAVLFDLDGTFADTAPDLAHALNQTLQAHQRPMLSLDQIRPVVSHGGKALIQLGFGIDETHNEFETLRQQLLDFYQQDIAQHTQLFPGIAPLITTLTAQQYHWGIVTNKPSWLTEPLMKVLDPDQQACCVVSGDTLTERKPHPAPLLHGCQQCEVEPEETLYIGDAERDIIAGKRAGMYTMTALYGYIGADEQPDHWQSTAYVQHPDDILPWLLAHNQTIDNTSHYAN